MTIAAYYFKGIIKKAAQKFFMRGLLVLQYIIEEQLHQQEQF
jgi:hypothetical protein